MQAITRQIPGLAYRLAYITEQEERDLLAWVDGQPWITDLRRRVQHYGWRYDYKARRIDSAMRLGELPARLAGLAERLATDGIAGQLPDQVIVNEYQPGQGIAPHIDCKPCFGETIITISLGGACIMEFTRDKSNSKQANRIKGIYAVEETGRSEKPVSLWLQPRSVIAMQAAARRCWRHGIPARRSDTWHGVKFGRVRRVSLTFRKVIG